MQNLLLLITWVPTAIKVVLAVFVGVMIFLLRGLIVNGWRVARACWRAPSTFARLDGLESWRRLMPAPTALDHLSTLIVTTETQVEDARLAAEAVARLTARVREVERTLEETEKAVTSPQSVAAKVPMLSMEVNALRESVTVLTTATGQHYGEQRRVEKEAKTEHRRIADRQTAMVKELGDVQTRCMAKFVLTDTFKATQAELVEMNRTLGRIEGCLKR